MNDALSAWLLSPIGKQADILTPSCWVFPVHGIVNGRCTCNKYPCGENNKQAGKHPFTHHGVKDASNDIEQVARMFQYRTDLNLAVRTGKISGIFVLDVDGRSGGFESLQTLINQYGELPKTVMVETGNGSHEWYNYPKDMEIRNRTGLRSGIDIRGENGYVLAPHSTHASGKIYKLVQNSVTATADAPSWFLELIQHKKEPEPKEMSRNTNPALSEWTENDIRDMLSFINPSLDYSAWIQVGMGIHDWGGDYNLWQDWSKGGTNYEPNCCAPHWRSFKANGGISLGTLVQMAQLRGWKPAPPPPTDLSMISPLIHKAEEMIKPPKKKPLPVAFDAMKIPGLIGDTVRWITRYALKKQPELALLNTLAFAGSVFGRRYASQLNTRTNMYVVGVAETGSGKENSRKMIKELANYCGLDERIGADAIRSDSGMLRGLMNNASQLMMLDEFGHFLEGISNEKSPHYVRSQVGILLKLYSASNSVYNHGDYADKKAESIIIHAPNLCLYGTSTEKNYVKALRMSAIESGELNRFIVIRGRSAKEYPDREMPDYEIDEEIADKWKVFSPKFGNSLGVIINNSDVVPDPVIIRWGECDDLQYMLHCRQADKTDGESPLRHLWGRFFENTVKIAMIFAIARNPEKPEFRTEDFDIAQAITESSIEYLTNLAANHISETPQEESNNEIVNAIKDAGGKMGRRDIMRKFRKIKKRELDDIINGLIEQEIIDAERLIEGDKGRPKTFYKIIKD